MSLDFDHLEASVRAALALPVLQADAARCSARIDLVVTDAAPAQSSPAHRISLWAGAPGGPAVTLSAGAGVWAEVFAAVPPVGRQSVGALRRQCPGFVLEGALLGVASAIGGALLSLLITLIINLSEIRMPPPPGMAKGIVINVQVLPEVYLLAALAMIVTLAMASFLPARRAARAPIVASLAHV